MHLQDLKRVLSSYDFLVSFHQQSDVAISYADVLKVNMSNCALVTAAGLLFAFIDSSCHNSFPMHKLYAPTCSHRLKREINSFNLENIRHITISCRIF